MILRQEGMINNIIYDNTVYNNGKFRFYPTMMDLKNLINKLIDANATTEYIRLNPFYINAKQDRQIEFDEFMFYIECREKYNEDNLVEFIENCKNKKAETMSKDEYTNAQIQFVLCDSADIKKFGESLNLYFNYLYEIIPKMVAELTYKYDIKEEDLLFGYFCFEVDSE